MPFGVGPAELIIVLVIALLVLGPGKLPEVGASLGKTIREFRKASSDLEESVNLNPTAPNRLASNPVAPNVLSDAEAVAPGAARDVTPRGTPTDPVEESN
jgi:sec-independent protein translocase protein TatA